MVDTETYPHVLMALWGLFVFLPVKDWISGLWFDRKALREWDEKYGRPWDE